MKPPPSSGWRTPTEAADSPVARATSPLSGIAINSPAPALSTVSPSAANNPVPMIIAAVDREESAVLGDVAVRVRVALDLEGRAGLLASREGGVRDVEPEWLAGPGRSLFVVRRRANRPLVAVPHEPRLVVELDLGSL